MTGIKKFNWVRRQTAWQSAQAWTTHRRQMTQRFLDDGATARAAFAGALNSLSSGLATLATQAAKTQASAAARRPVSSVDRLA